ncbi:pseudouridine synthase [Desulfonatronum thiodismutans]|uniref:pseudouridine synthase n=1 Tax=Desulfonatronum thiodismutans TaxID=159290 RepID=UPI0004ABD7E9|nr:pseudouridine synthase [Desulfonatronum thiodismutans]
MTEISLDMPGFEPFSSEYAIPDDCHGLRLDQALARLVPGLGRRGARRIFEECPVDVDGRVRVAGFRVSRGQRVRIGGHVNVQKCDSARQGDVWTHLEAEPPTIQVAVRNADFAALVKPAGVHCERLPERLFEEFCQSLSGKPRNQGVGRARLTLEEALPDLFPGASATFLNRLDHSVSGLVLAALHERAARDYATWQDQGRVRKTYWALVCGRLTSSVVIRSALDTAKRRKVRALSEEEPDALRWTRVTPLVAPKAECLEVADVLGAAACLGGGVVPKVPWDAVWERAGEVTLVRVEIYKGRRHQIRAHLASIGHAVLFDPLYGSGPNVGWISLHHREILLPGFRADSGKEFKLLRGYRQCLPRHSEKKRPGELAFFSSPM